MIVWPGWRARQVQSRHYQDGNCPIPSRGSGCLSKRARYPSWQSGCACRHRHTARRLLQYGNRNRGCSGGRFAGWKAMENGSTGSYEELSSLGGSYLNYSILRDGWWYQDYSYLLKTGKDDETYSDILLSVLHPAGLKVFFEKTLEDYVPIGGSTTEYNPYASLPILENYFPYKMTSTEDVNVCVGCSGTLNTSSYYGVGYTYDAPAHKHPVWSIKVPSGITPEFGEFNIWNFVELAPLPGSTINPNDGISACADISGCLSIPIFSP